MNRAIETLTERAQRERLDFSDEQLLAECEVHTYRASGPGGQKRNKTFSAVRLRHRPSGLTVVGTESRSQHENKARALRRLREAIAVTYRTPLAEEVHWPGNVQIVQRRLKVNPKNPSLFHVLALLLDALAAQQGKLAGAAESLGLSSSSFVRFLAGHPKAWTEANRIRKRFERPALRS